MNETNDYNRLDELLRALQIAHGAPNAAEAHGSLCALLTAPHGEETPWLDRVLDMPLRLPASDRQWLHELKAQTALELQEGDFRFHPLLPDDEASLEQRADALAAWCEGFVSGLGLYGSKLPSLSSTGREALADLQQIARTDMSEVAGEEDEQHFCEVLEFVRTSAMLLFDELSQETAPAAKSPHAHRTH
jgi:hypothetical protein